MQSPPAGHVESLTATPVWKQWEGNLVASLSSAVPDWGAVFAGAINTSMGGGGAPGIGSKQDQSIGTLLAEFQAAPSISLGDFPTLDESFLRQTGTLALLMHSELFTVSLLRGMCGDACPSKNTGSSGSIGPLVCVGRSPECLVQ